MLTNLDESLEFFKREKGKGGEVRGKNEESMKQVRGEGGRGERGRGFIYNTKRANTGGFRVEDA
jgi:hypothetical protein